MLIRQWGLRAAVLTSLVQFLAGYSLAAAAEPPFYQGKAITVVEGRNPGGSAGIRTQVVFKYLQKYLPGNPPIVFQYMPGAGGTAAANYLAKRAKRDGLTIASIGTAVYSNAIFGARGVRYKLEDFVFLGSPAESGGPYTIVIRPDLHLDTVEKLRAYRGLRFGSRSVGHGMYVVDRVMAFLLDLKNPRWILGYSTPEIHMALERGEADARSNNVHSFLRDTPHWLNEGYTVPVVMKGTDGKGAESFPEFRHSILMDQYIDTELKRGVMELFKSSKPSTTVFFVAKGTPPAALKALKEALNKVWNDPEFFKDYQRMTNLPAEPVTGEEITRRLRNRPKASKVMEVYRQLIGPGPLPPGK